MFVQFMSFSISAKFGFRLLRLLKDSSNSFLAISLSERIPSISLMIYNTDKMVDFLWIVETNQSNLVLNVSSIPCDFDSSSSDVSSAKKYFIFDNNLIYSQVLTVKGQLWLLV